MPLDTRLPMYKFQVDPIKEWDILSPIIQGQQIAENRMKQKAYLRDMQDKEKIKSILANSKKSDGGMDFEKASTELERGGFIDQADTIRKYSMEKANNEGLRSFQNKFREGKAQPDLTEMVSNPDYDPRLKNEMGQLDQLKQNPFVASPDFIRSTNKEQKEFGPQLPESPMYELNLDNLSTNQRNAPGAKDPFAVNVQGGDSSMASLNSLADLYANQTPEFLAKTIKQPSKPYSFQEGVDMYMKEVPFKDEESAAKFMKLLDPKEGISETERKEKIVDQAMEHLFGTESGKMIYNDAVKMYGGEGSEAKQKALTTLVSEINASDIPGSVKGLMIDRVTKNFKVPELSTSEQVAKGMMVYNATLPTKTAEKIAEEQRGVTRKKAEEARAIENDSMKKAQESFDKFKTNVTTIRSTLKRDQGATALQLEPAIAALSRLYSDEAVSSGELERRIGSAAGNVVKQYLNKGLQTFTGSGLASTTNAILDMVDDLEKGREAAFKAKARPGSGKSPDAPKVIRKKFNPATGEIE